jgi:cytoskeletal protein CcmA (bactofilin family)
MLFSKKPAESATVSRPLPVARPPAADPAANAPRTQIVSPTQSVIDAWLIITGNLESEGDVRVEGQVAGDIRCANLVIGREATVSGDIVAEEAIVRGRVKGTIRANRVVLQDTACVESAIYHKMLAIDEGASFDGQSCQRQQPHQDDATAPRVGKPGATPERDAPTIDGFSRSNGATVAGLRPADA